VTAVRRRTELPAKTRAAFLALLAEGWSITGAAKRLGWHRQRFYMLRERDEEFAKAWDEAWTDGADWIEDELRRAATEGWDEETFEGGKLVRRIRKRDPRLLTKHARARQPMQETERGPAVIILQSAFGAVRPSDAAVVLEAREVPELERGEP
jgi:hypothetical protein